MNDVVQNELNRIIKNLEDYALVRIDEGDYNLYNVKYKLMVILETPEMVSGIIGGLLKVNIKIISQEELVEIFNSPANPSGARSE